MTCRGCCLIAIRLLYNAAAQPAPRSLTIDCLTPLNNGLCRPLIENKSLPHRLHRRLWLSPLFQQTSQIHTPGPSGRPLSAAEGRCPVSHTLRDFPGYPRLSPLFHRTTGIHTPVRVPRGGDGGDIIKRSPPAEIALCGTSRPLRLGGESSYGLQARIRLQAGGRSTDSDRGPRSEEHTSELQSHSFISYAV